LLWPFAHPLELTSLVVLRQLVAVERLKRALPSPREISLRFFPPRMGGSAAPVSDLRHVLALFGRSLRAEGLCRLVSSFGRTRRSFASGSPSAPTATATPRSASPTRRETPWTLGSRRRSWRAAAAARALRSA